MEAPEGDDRATDCAGLQVHLGLDRGVAPRIENLAAQDDFNRAHVRLLSLSQRYSADFGRRSLFGLTNLVTQRRRAFTQHAFEIDAREASRPRPTRSTRRPTRRDRPTSMSASPTDSVKFSAASAAQRAWRADFSCLDVRYRRGPLCAAAWCSSVSEGSCQAMPSVTLSRPFSARLSLPSATLPRPRR